eukprot:4965381-Amphidinium_carterae.1
MVIRATVDLHSEALAIAALGLVGCQDDRYNSRRVENAERVRVTISSICEILPATQLLQRYDELLETQDLYLKGH